jgi:endonuclease/exonuclease/phosphatase family metal-dependent hydrolase
MPEVVFATYNIHGGIGGDGRRDLARIARVLAPLECDVVALQEVTNRLEGAGQEVQADFLAESLKMEAVRGPTLLRGDEDYGNALLTRLPLRALRRLDLSEAGREPRGALDVELEKHGRPLRLIATHLGLRPWERRRQVRRLLEEIPRSPVRPLILLGDLNEWLPGSRPLRWLVRELGGASDIPTFPARRPLLALDRALVTPAHALIDLQAMGGGEASVASDHLPLCGRVRLEPR